MNGKVLINTFMDMPPRSFLRFSYFPILYGSHYLKKSNNFLITLIDDIVNYDVQMMKERKRKHRYKTYQRFNAKRV